MSGRNEERWKSLCEEASKEKDPDRLMELVEKINSILGDDAPGNATTPKPADAA